MAVSAQPKLDAQRVRADFPIFEHPIHGKPLAYLDSAASSQKPRQVLDAMTTFYETSYANIHRGVYDLAERSTEAYEAARETVRAFVNAGSAREIVFTRNVTAALNIVAYGWGLDNLGPGDLVLATELEHHSNFVPWQYIAGRTGAEFAVVPVDAEGELQLDDLDALLARGRPKVLACAAVNNSLGTILPVPRLVEWAHANGAIVGRRRGPGGPAHAGRRAGPRRRLRRPHGPQAVRADRHRRPLGPGGAARGDVAVRARRPHDPQGHGREDDLERDPAQVRGRDAAIAEAVGFAAAIDYVTEAGLPAIERHEHELLAYALGRLGEVPGVRLYGPPADRRVGIVSFSLEGVHPHDVAQIVDAEGVAVRAGHHCNQPLMAKLGVNATTRASFYLYTLPEEIDRLVDGLHAARKLFS